jgi:hypothetical protein
MTSETFAPVSAKSPYCNGGLERNGQLLPRYLQYQNLAYELSAIAAEIMDRNDDHHGLIALAQDYHKVAAELIAMLEPTKHAEIK